MANEIVRIAIIDKDKCKPKKCNKECKKICPVNSSGKICVEIDIEKVAKINEDLCIGCNGCVKKCPFGAIKLVKLPTELNKIEQIYMYGENMFRFYKLPIPKMGKIIGILGKNGIGKSTIMNILSGKIIPNFGNFDKDNDRKEVLNKLRGTEIQKYLNLLYSGKLKINMKMQNIESVIRQHGDKLVIDVLGTYTKEPQYNIIIKELDLEKLLNNKIENLSGGELQKVICSLSLLKKADVYIFDEPTNYLDIEYRVKIANLIKNNNTETTYTFVVEHDLSILDYLSDFIHIIYGKPAVYGVCATQYSSLEAINIFFDGFIPADNIRFRKEPWKLTELNQSVSDEEIGKSTYSVQYENNKISFDNFVLEIPDTKIDAGTNIIVLLGKNGTGKSTYLNHIKNNVEMRTSYKGQINNLESIKKYTNYSVRDFLYNTVVTAMTTGTFLTDVVNILHVDKLYDKILSNLSGGELQRVLITHCLGTPAEIYLIDEPSASLDIEQRVNVIKAIKRFIIHNKKMCYIIEHDIMMAISLGLEWGSKIIVLEEQESKNNKRYCTASNLLDFKTGINRFLKNLNITFRSDPNNKRPRINKLNSTKDHDQKIHKKYYD